MIKAGDTTEELDNKVVVEDIEQSEDEDSEHMNGEIRDLLENSTEESVEEESKAAESGTEKEETQTQQTASAQESETETKIEQSSNEAAAQGKNVVTEELIAKYPFLRDRAGQSVEEALNDYSHLQTAYGRSQQELAAEKQKNNASEETKAQENELANEENFPDPLDDPQGYIKAARESILAEAQQLVDAGLQKVRPLQAESAEKQIIKAITPHLPKETKPSEAIFAFKNDVLMKLSPQERDRRIDYYDKFPDVFIQDIANNAKVQNVLTNANQESKSEVFKKTREALNNAETHEDTASFNNARTIEDESPEDKLLSTIEANLEDEEDY